MSEPLIFSILFILIYIYMILASVDFGAGFYTFYVTVIKKSHSLFRPLRTYLSPVSEVINVCFVLFFAVMSGFSTDLSFRYQTPLAFSGILAVIFILIKGTFFTFAEFFSENSLRGKICLSGNGLAGILVPAALSITMVVSEGGFPGQERGLMTFITELFTNFYFWTVILIAMISVLYVSAVYFSGYGRKIHNEELSENMRYLSLMLSIPVLLASGLVFLGLEMQNPDHFSRALDFSWLFLLSLLSFLVAVTLIFIKQKYSLAFILVMLQYFFALTGYGLSHLPYIIYPDIRISDATVSIAGQFWFYGLLLILSLLAVGLILHMKRVMISRNQNYKRDHDL
ncbi:cytochrome d ubiquinol oxidase subunit II [Sporolactobacillus sp. Y61]|uniref:Cytochrome d ubiquinol oxidase subunit II n=1 Tax=Sporolactobacillus sp. Y61 TaxID=3160863 RepID=A0AAU8ICT9_9BACL